MVRSSILLLAAFGLVQNADAFSAPIPQASVKVDATAEKAVEAPPAEERGMPPPYGAVSPVVEATEGRMPGTHNQPPGNKWWEPAGMYGTHASIKTSTGTFQTYTDAMKNPYNPKISGPNPSRVPGAYNQQATGNWWDRPVKTDAGTFQTYTDVMKNDYNPKINGPNPPRVAGAYNQQATGNWWDRPAQVQTHDSIKTSNGFQVYSDALRGEGKAKIDGPEPERISGAYNQQATGNWWDRRQEINSHNDINTSAGFPTYTDIMRERSQ
mmetsp:Transcript_21167/g.31981  ORF Transcript_21167/g.31981 Transcript_21167/m.31981 type:complete len:268 (-) Transcript_21167:188-991(-)